MKRKSLFRRSNRKRQSRHPSLTLTKEKETEDNKVINEKDKYVQTKFNLFVSKLCLSEETKNYVFFNEYKKKMSQMLHTVPSPPDIQLLKDEDLPPHLRELAILTGYRSPSSSVKECALSVFAATNETLNFWTHFLPTFYFLYQLANTRDLLDPYHWPFAVYMCTVCLYPLTSALAHTFCSVSDMARHVWFFLDYGFLSLYAFGAGLFIKAYAFPTELQDSIMGVYFVEVLVLLTIACSVLACYSRFLDSLFWIKVFRLGAFALPWIWDNIPMMYRLSRSEDLDPEAAEHYYLQFFFSFCIGFFYASHLPECLAPGKFDLVGNSHQLLHVSGIMATHHQMSGIVMDMYSRRQLLEQKYPFPEYWSLYVSPLVLFSICSTIGIFILCAQHYENNRKDLKRDN